MTNSTAFKLEYAQSIYWKVCFIKLCKLILSKTFDNFQCKKIKKYVNSVSFQDKLNDAYKTLDHFVSTKSNKLLNSCLKVFEYFTLARILQKR